MLAKQKGVVFFRGIDTPMHTMSTSVVNGHAFMIASTSTSRVCKDSSDKLLPRVFSKEFKIALVLWIWHSETPAMLVNSGGFLFHIIHSPSFTFKKLSILIWSIFWNAQVSSVNTSNKVRAIVKSNHPNITSAPYKSSQAHGEWISAQITHKLSVYGRAW